MMREETAQANRRGKQTVSVVNMMCWLLETLGIDVNSDTIQGRDIM